MKNRLSDVHPTPEELYAYELKARRMRSQEISRLVHSALATIKSLFTVRKVHHA